MPQGCWSCGPVTRLGEPWLRERNALPKNGSTGAGTRNRNTLHLSPISAVHTLILLKHDFVYTLNLLKKPTLPSLLITFTTVNQKLQTMRNVPHLSFMFLMSWPIRWPSKNSKPPSPTHLFILRVLPGVHSYPPHSFCLSKSSLFLKTQLNSFFFINFFFQIK